MINIIRSLVVITIFFSISGSALATQHFDYYFGSFAVPAQKIISSVFSVSVPVSGVSNVTVNNPNLGQISSMQANLNQIKTTLANLNLALTKPKKEVAVTYGIPLVLEKATKEEKNTPSIFASLIPPDVRNSPLIATHLTILTLGLFGVITYLFFLHRKGKKQSVV